MAGRPEVDGLLVQWGDRLYYPGNRKVGSADEPRLSAMGRSRANVIRARIAATVVRRAPQVVVKVTGGGRGMKAITAHFRYITKNGRLAIEDERGQSNQGKDAVGAMVEDWRYGGAVIEDVSHRREAFNIMLSMPRGVDALTVQRAAREFATAELADHKYVMVLHDHQAHPHVHLSVRAESKYGKRLNPRKADLQRWRETFAEKLRDWGVDAEATRRFTRGQGRGASPLWRIKAREEGRERHPNARDQGSRSTAQFAPARYAWRQIALALSASSDRSDRALAGKVTQFWKREAVGREKAMDKLQESVGTRNEDSLRPDLVQQSRR